jgi:hypothetical protein
LIRRYELDVTKPELLRRADNHNGLSVFIRE